jgi:formimidoylglutamate deiminase
MAAHTGGVVELLFERALVPTGIARHVAVHVGDDGTLLSVVAGAQPESRADASIFVPGLALCGMPNLHSHAFQRGIAGATEVAATAENSFWGWRESMYRFVGRLEPADVEAIAALAYVEMLEAGYTSVAEFHYLHHQTDGRPYADCATMSAAVRMAAERTGIRQLLLPCLYQAAGFGPLPAMGGQRRFAHETQQFLRLFEQLLAQASGAHTTGLQTTGIELHSLRAVPIAALREVISALPSGVPIHIHIAEQQREVEECLKFSARRPIEYLLDHVAVDQHWCLVHATHATPAELRAISQLGAVVGVCSTTEANLGDGCFPLDDFVSSGGRFGIGSDSQVSIDPREELRAAEYALRLLKQRRGLVCQSAQLHCGTSLYSLASSGGAQALGLTAGELVAGAVADIVVIDTNQAQFAGIRDEALLDAHVFAPRPGCVRDVLVAGRWVVRDGRHAQREFVMEGYRRSVARLLQ